MGLQFKDNSLTSQLLGYVAFSSHKALSAFYTPLSDPKGDILETTSPLCQYCTA